MTYKALYRTYRPSTFDEVAGQEHIVKTLKNALATRKLAHAYLFAGPRGTGKTTMAKLLAKGLNCDEGIGCQCNECKNCRAIIDGTHPDVLELDAASNNGVDEIRELIDKVKYGTILGRYKVYIIDEVHMLSTGAFNALLKTLEEPPEHVIFILATTEPHKILPTILSRCQRYDFTKLSDTDIKNRLKSVLEKENIAFNEEAVDIIISLADGGMRDALSILDQVLAYSDNKLEVKDVLDMFALESKEEKIALLNAVINNDVLNVLERINNYIALGIDIKRLTDDLLIILKDILIYQSSRNTSCLESLNEEEANVFARKIDIDSTLKMIDIIMSAQKDYKNVTSINPLFEVTMLKLAAIKKNGQFVETIKEPEPIKPVEERPQPKPAPAKQPDVKHETVQQDLISLLDQPEDNEPEPEPEIVLSKDVLVIKGVRNGSSFLINDDMMIDIMVISKKDIKNQLINEWQNIKRYITHPTLGKAASMIIDGRPLVASKNILVVEYSFPNTAERANLIENQEAIQNVIESAFGKKMFVYGVSRKDSVRSQQNYMNKLQLSKLPKADNVNIEFEGE